MASIGMDLKFAARMLFKNRIVTVVAVLMLAVGIGGNTAIFSVVNAILLSPLPYPDSERLVVLRDVQPGLDEAPSSYPEYLDWKDQSGIFDTVATSFSTATAWTGDGEPESLRAARVTASLLPMLGVKPLLGRTFTDAEETPQGERVALLSRGLWRRRFNADPGVLGRSLTLDGQPWTVIGVLPIDRVYENRAEVVLPLRLDVERAPRGLHFMPIVGRLKPGLSMAQARADADAVSRRMREEKTTEHGVKLVGLKEATVGDTGTTLLLIMGALGAVLLIVCANIASLLLAWAATRQKEVAVRLAVGAARWHLVRQFLVESAVLSLAGATLGVLLAWWGVDLVGAVPFRIPRIDEVRIDTGVLGFSLALSLASAVLFGLAPALQAASTNLNETLKETGRSAGGGRGRQRLRNGLVVGEVALSLVLLIGAGLLLRSLMSVLSVPRGFEAGGLLTMEMSLARSDYKEPERQAAFFAQVLERTAGLDGVEGAAIVNHPPLGDGNTNGDVLVEGITPDKDKPLLADLRRVSPDYFRVMRIPLLQGRWFTARDDAKAPDVVVVNRAFADKFLPGVDPIGHRVDVQWDRKGWQEIVGVVGNVKHDGLDLPVNPEVYMPYAQVPMAGMVMVIRTRGEPMELSAAVREQVHAVDPDMPVYAIRTMDQILSSSIGARRLGATFVGAFAALALGLGAIGLYGVLAFWVAQRRREIGIRMALGARGRDVLRLVVGHGLSLTVGGVVIGIAGGLAIGRLIARFLFGVTAHDPAVLAGIPMLVAAVTLLACYIPARRASRVDPMVALRSE